jgi:hypothetical protein
MFGFEVFRQLRNQFRAERVGAFDNETLGFGFDQSECDRET